MKRKRKKYRKYLPLYLMMVPSLIYLIVNNYLPMFGIGIAFKKMNFAKGFWKSDWVGLKNFEFLFRTNDAWKIIRNTIGYNLVFIVLGTVVAVALAILLNEVVSKRWLKVYQTSILLPYMVSIIIVGYIVYGLLCEEGGLVNSLLNSMGLDSVKWYSTPKYWPFILTIVYLWKSSGYTTIVYYATIVGIDKSYYEAASVDGAGKLKQMIYITLPCMKSTIITMVLMSVGKIFYSDFGLFYQVPMNIGVLQDVTNTIDTYVYRALMQLNDIGMSSAASVLQSVVGFITVLTANAIVKKISEDDALF